LLWPTLIALWLASDGKPDWKLVAIFCLGTALMRSAGCAINDYADRDFDKYVKRTAQRPITSGKIAGWEAVMVATVLALVSLLLILPLNTLTKQLSVAAVIIAGRSSLAATPISNAFLQSLRPTSELHSASASRWVLPQSKIHYRLQLGCY
jgi:hypothetical protein